MAIASPPTHETPIEARSSLETADGRLDVIARSRGDRWWVSVMSADATAAGIGPEIGVALLAALELSGVDAEDIDL